MINNLNLNSLLNMNATPQMNGEADLLKLIGQGQELSQDQDILSLLEGSETSETADFSSLLDGVEQAGSDETSQEALKVTKIEAAVMNNLDQLVLNSSDSKNVEKLVSQLDRLINESELGVQKLVKLIETKPELKEKLTALIQNNQESLKEIKNLKSVTELIVKDSKTPFNTSTVNEKVQNKLEINKMLGLSSEELLESKSKAQTQVKPMLKQNPFKMADVNNNKMIKAQPEVMQKAVAHVEQAVNNKPVINKDSSNVDMGNPELDLGLDSNDHQTVKLENTIIRTNKVNAPTKVFDINQVLNSGDTTDTVISKIQDYIIQSKVSNEQNVQMSFKHQDLGSIDLQVSKLAGDSLGVNIAANSSEAIKFFTENKAELLQALTNSGVNISEFKLEAQNSSSLSKDSNSSNQSFADSKGEFSGSKQGQEDKEAKKRQELWEMFDKETA